MIVQPQCHANAASDVHGAVLAVPYAAVGTIQCVHTVQLCKLETVFMSLFNG